MEPVVEIREERIDYKALFFRILSHWRIIFVSLGIASVLASLRSCTTPPVYLASIDILINVDKDKYGYRSQDNIQDGFGLFSQKQILENEIIILKSYTLIYQTLGRLDFDVNYYHIGRWINRELYFDRPFSVVADSLPQWALASVYEVEIQDNGDFLLRITHGDSKNSLSGQFGREIQVGDARFTLHPESGVDIGAHGGNKYRFAFNNRQQQTLYYQSALAIAPVNKEATIVSMSLRGQNLDKIVVFLNELAEVYIEQNLEKKNRIATNTIEFINEQLTDISDSLTFTEEKLQNFRTTNQVTDLSFQAQKLFEQIQMLDNELSALLMKSKYYEYIKTYFASGSNFEDLMAPSAMNIENPLLNSLVMELITLSAERNAFLEGNREKNPYIQTLALKIENLKKTISESIQGAIESNSIAIADLRRRIEDVENEINKLPRKERQLFGIEREFKLNDAVYTFLLQKRAEAQIARASNLSDHEVIDPARNLNQQPIAPKKGVNLIIALMIGFTLPILHIFLKDYFNEKVREKADVTRITDYPIIGYVFHSEKDVVNVVGSFPKSPVAEAYRAVRTNLQFYAKDARQQTILVTSSLSQEGKTFNAINLAAAFALYGKRTVLLGFDLRKPKMASDIKVSNEVGLSSFLSRQALLDDITRETDQDNLWVIPSGPVPPNPVELLASNETQQLFAELRKRYEYIIIDTPPVGIVTDAYLLTAYSDVNIYVVRQNHTPRKILTTIIEDVNRNELKNVCILINDINRSNSSYYGRKYGYGYGYGYAYGYDYGYGYYDDGKRKKAAKLRARLKALFRTLFKRKKSSK